MMKGGVAASGPTGVPGAERGDLDPRRTELRRAITQAKAQNPESVDPEKHGLDEFLAHQKVRLARERAVCAAYRAGLSIDEISEELEAEPITIYRIIQRYNYSEGLGSP